MSRSRAALTALAAAPLLLGLVACGDDEPDDATRASDPPASTEPSTEPSTDDAIPQPPPSTAPDLTGELAEHDGQPCPAKLPEPAVSGPGAEAATGRPDLPAPDRAWVCDYELADGGGWERREPLTPVQDDDLAGLAEGVAALRPASNGRFCTKELGPRHLLVLDTDGDLTGVLLDGFGCGDVRLTDDPHETPAGEPTAPGVVPGVLQAEDLFALEVERYASARRPE
jgi:hypothetical protein